MRTGLALAMIGAMLATGCTRNGGHGLLPTARYHPLPCEGIAAERVHVEQATARLHARVSKKGAFARPDAQAGAASWPTYVFTRDKGPRDRQRYQQLSMSYEQLRIAARQRGCAMAFAPDVSKTVPVATGG